MNYRLYIRAISCSAFNGRFSYVPGKSAGLMLGPQKWRDPRKVSGLLQQGAARVNVLKEILHHPAEQLRKFEGHLTALLDESPNVVRERVIRSLDGAGPQLTMRERWRSRRSRGAVESCAGPEAACTGVADFHEGRVFREYRLRLLLIDAVHRNHMSEKSALGEVAAPRSRETAFESISRHTGDLFEPDFALLWAPLRSSGGLRGPRVESQTSIYLSISLVPIKSPSSSRSDLMTPFTQGSSVVSNKTD